jgi:hypothetical protein
LLAAEARPALSCKPGESVWLIKLRRPYVGNRADVLSALGRGRRVRDVRAGQLLACANDQTALDVLAEMPAVRSVESR